MSTATHQETLRRAAEHIRTTLLHGGSGHDFYAATADLFDALADDFTDWCVTAADVAANRAAEALIGTPPRDEQRICLVCRVKGHAAHDLDAHERAAAARSALTASTEEDNHA